MDTFMGQNGIDKHLGLKTNAPISTVALNFNDPEIWKSSLAIRNLIEQVSLKSTMQFPRSWNLAKGANATGFAHSYKYGECALFCQFQNYKCSLTSCIFSKGITSTDRLQIWVKSLISKMWHSIKKWSSLVQIYIMSYSSLFLPTRQEERQGRLMIFLNDPEPQ